MNTLKRIRQQRFQAVTLGFMLTAEALLGGCSGHSAPDATNVAQWNGIATQAVLAFDAANPPGLPPMVDSRIYAMAFSAVHDALNAIDRRYQPYLSDLSARGADPNAAVAQAVHDVMVNELPPEATFLNAQLIAALAAIPDGTAKQRGIDLGSRCAQAIIAARSNDGSANAQGPYSAPTDPGVYQPTIPVGVATFVNWGQVTPFVATSGMQFRAPPPYTVQSPAYTADYNEVKTLGAAVNSTRTADQSEIARFWLENSSLGWDRIAMNVAAARGLNGWDQARLYALLELAIADSYITSLESKYFYRFWRPITAIRQGDSDGNADTVGDASWAPFDFVTPPVPDYPSAHSSAGGAAHAVLDGFFGTDAVSFSLTSTSLPGVTRHYTSFTQAEAENAASRVYVGYHFRLATTVGITQGEEVGNLVVTTRLRPAR